MENKEYKILLVGDNHVGKTAFLKRIQYGEFEKNYVPTKDGVEFMRYNFNTNYGLYNLLIGVGEDTGMEADGVIIMFDLSSPFNNLDNWIRKVRNPAKVIVGNKADIVNPKVASIDIQKKYLSIKYINVSARSWTNLEKPFLYLLRSITGNKELYFIEKPAIDPPLVIIDVARIKKENNF